MDTKRAKTVMNFEGLISAPFTAFSPNGEVNANVIPAYVDHLVKDGVKGVFVNGTTGEGLSLTVAERKTIAESWVEHGKNKLDLIIIQVGANSIEDAKELAKHAEKIGATGIASLPPLFYKPTTHEHLIEYFKQIHEAAPTMPLMLYHIPSYSGVEITLGEFLPKVHEKIPNFVGAKFTSVDVRDLLKCNSLSKPKFKLLSGFDEVLLPCMASGVTAAVGATYNFMAKPGLEVMRAYKEGRLEDARKISYQILEAVQTIASHGQGIACFKAAMNMITNMDFGPTRVPLVPLDSAAISDLKKDLQKLKLCK